MEVTKSVLADLDTPDPSSHKGGNGRVLVIAGSDKFHGALLLCVQTVSRIVDMVYVHSVEKNMPLVEALKSDMSTFIGVTADELWQTVDAVDVVIVGPGLAETEENATLVERLLKEFPKKKIIVDATAFWYVDPEMLHSNCVVTPHSREFAHTFGVEAQSDNVKAMAEKYGCVVVLTGQIDYVSDGKELYENHTGNVGMTKGGTGDVLVGLIGGLLASNDCLQAALAGVYLNGAAGDALEKQHGTFYNADDVIHTIGDIWKHEMH